ncbi:MAG TPA: carboxymuconolactone decarboxylase family protein [Geothrix sp.]|nr:carboxymuconolactone decarboxylase family protein [Geothrix sp.]
MQPRLDYTKASPGALQAMLGLETHVHKAGLEPSLVELVKLRVSQINGCAFCLDMHTKELRAAEVAEQRLYLLSAWREAPMYTDREKAALAWGEALTRLPGDGVPDEVFERARAHFGEAQLVDLTLAIVAINGWNRLNIGFRTPAGNYVARSAAALVSGT